MKRYDYRIRYEGDYDDSVYARKSNLIAAFEIYELRNSNEVLASTQDRGAAEMIVNALNSVEAAKTPVPYAWLKTPAIWPLP